MSFLDGIRFPTGLYVTMRDGDIRHSGSDSSDGQYNKEFQLSLALFLSSAEGIEKEQSTLWKGRKLLFPSISRNKKKIKERSNSMYQERQSKESRQGYIDSLSSSFAGLLRPLQKKEKRESQDGCISPYGRSITNLYRKFMRITAAW